MKKLLISIIGIIILILCIVSIFSGIKVWKINIWSVQDIKAANAELDAKIEEANTQVNQNYAKSISTISTSINNLREAKGRYENAINSLGLNAGLGVTQIEKYKIEYLEIKIGNYSKKSKLIVDLDIQKTSIEDTYNINFTVQGSYSGITDFLYAIENDDELNYRIKNFTIEPTSITQTTTSNNTQTTVNTDKLQAKFVVENIIIKFD